MARRTGKSPSRLELRRANDAAEERLKEGGAEPAGDEAKPAKKAAAKKPAVKRKSTKKKSDPTRMRMVWGVFDNSNQQIASFPYNDRASADKRVVDLSEKGRGPYFVQPVKEPMPIESPKEEDA